MDRHQVTKLSKFRAKMKLILTLKVSQQTQTTKVAHEDLHLSQLKNKIVQMPPKLENQLPKLPKLLETTMIAVSMIASLNLRPNLYFPESKKTKFWNFCVSKDYQTTFELK